MYSSKILVYDGSFDGFLTAIFVAFEEKVKVANIQKQSSGQNEIFSDTENITTQLNKSSRVRRGIQAKNTRALKRIYFAYLSEIKGIELLLYHFIKRLFSTQNLIQSDYSDSVVLKITQVAKSVGREKHRMEAFVRFQLTKDNIYFANIEPDFDVLPLISGHFSTRYADQLWIIYDLKRKYGLFYNKEKVEFISLDLQEVHVNSIRKSAAFLMEEYNYQALWNDYFKSTSIKSRINKKLHIQHVPKRYWKFLSEKKDDV